MDTTQLLAVTDPGSPREGSTRLARLEGRAITAWFGSHKVLDRVSLVMQPGEITALIGPSGCGKSTFLRILNRMHELVPSAQLAGEVLLDGEDIYDADATLIDARRAIGMVFQKPNPFPAMSIRENVLAGLKLTGTKASRSREGRAHRVLPRAGRSVERGQGPPRRPRRRPVRGSAAAPVHRPVVGDQAARAADGRAVLGARPDLDPGDRGDDASTWRARSRSSSSPTTCSRPPGSPTSARSSSPPRAPRGSSSSTARPRPCSSNPQDQRTRDYVMGRFG